MTEIKHRIIRLPEVLQRTGKSRASLYADIKKGLFPKPVPIGKRAVGWLEAEVDEWITSKIRPRSA